jgi:hypothetical protein
MLRNWFSDACSQLWLNFVNSTFPLFHDAVRKAEAQDVTAVESCVIHSHLKDKLNARKEENFIPVSVRELMSSSEEEGSQSKNQFLNVSHDFYSTDLQFIDLFMSPSVPVHYNAFLERAGHAHNHG